MADVDRNETIIVSVTDAYDVVICYISKCDRRKSVASFFNILY